MPQKAIAIIGASSRHDKFSNKAVRAYREAGYTVYPVHPKEETVDGLKVYRSVAEIPGPVEVANLYVAPEVGIGMLDAIAQKGIRTVFANPGADSPELLEKGKRLGLAMRAECSIVALGKRPSDYP